MTRTQLEHILRASAAITGADQFVIIGSQAILGQFADPPKELTTSIEADVYSLRSQPDSDLIEGSIGEGSPFHRTFGYFAHGVGEETSVLPTGWKDRLIPLSSSATGGATGLCLEVHDLAAAKLACGRDKDIEYVAALIRHRLARPELVEERITTLRLPYPELCRARLARAIAGV
jgi:hypothetical protein